MHKYTEAEIQFIRDHIKGRSYKDMTDLFNANFGLSINLKQMQGTLKRYNLRNELKTTFKPGHTPFNKGMKGVNVGGKETQFKKGNIPANFRAVGSERADADGYHQTKTANPSTWRFTHQLVWEKAHGPVPKGYTLIFADGDRTNIVLDNLLLVSRRQLAVLNKRHLIAKNAELTKTGLAIVDVVLKIGERKKSAKKKNSNKT